MPQLIDVPEVGLLEFPDEMNDTQIADAIKSNLGNLKPATPETAPATQETAPSTQEIAPAATPEPTVNPVSAARDELKSRLKEFRMLPAFTSAATSAWDKELVKENGVWKTPMLGITADKDAGYLEKLGLSMSSIVQGGLSKFFGAQTGSLDSEIKRLQQVHGLDDSQMQSAWSDLVNEYRTWEPDEKTRVLSDGTISLNPASRELLDTPAIEKIIDESGAPDQAKADAKRNLPNLQSNAAQAKLEGYEAAATALKSPGGRAALLPFGVGGQAISSTIEAPSEYAKRTGRKDTNTAAFMRDYERDVADGNPIMDFARGIATDWILGANNVAVQTLGAAGTLGSEKAGAVAAEGQEAANAITAGKPDTGITGQVVQQVLPIGAMMVATQLTGAAAALTGSEKVLGVVNSLSPVIYSGAQSAGAQYAQSRAEGKDHAAAQSDAAKAGATTALITGMFSAAGMGGVEDVAAGKQLAGVTLGDLLKSKGREEVVKNAKSFAGKLAKGFGEEFPEEWSDQLVSAFVNADPETNLSDAWQQAWDAGMVGGIMGTGTAAFTGNPEAAKTAIEIAPDLPDTAKALVEVTSVPKPFTVSDIPKVESNAPETPTEKVVPEGVPEAGNVPTPSGSGVATPESVAPVEAAPEAVAPTIPVTQVETRREGGEPAVAPSVTLAAETPQPQTPTPQTDGQNERQRQGQGRQELLTPATEAPPVSAGGAVGGDARRVADVVGSSSHHLDSEGQTKLADQLESLKGSSPEIIRKSLVASGAADGMDTASLGDLATETSRNGDAVVSRLRENAKRNAEKEALVVEKTPEEMAKETIRINEDTIAKLESTPAKTTEKRKNLITGEVEEVPLSEKRKKEYADNKAAYIQKLRDENAALRGKSNQPQTQTTNENQVQETGGTPPVESVPAQPTAAGETETGTALGSGQGQETVTPSPPANPRDSTYEKLFAKGKPAGPNMVELTDAQVTSAIRKKLASDRDTQRGLPGRPEETVSFYLRPKADVTGVSTDRGWILKDKRPDFIARNRVTRNITPSPREKLLTELGNPKNPGFPDKVITPEGVAVELTQDGAKIKVSVETPQEIRNTGKATAAMRRLTDLARRDGVTLDLDVVPMKDQPMSKEALTAWYAKLGFTDNGDGTMTFSPETTKPSVEKSVSDAHSELKKHAASSNREMRIAINATTGEEIGRVIGKWSEENFGESADWETDEQFRNYLDSEGLIDMHTHPDETSFSDGDWGVFSWSQVKELHVVTQTGKLYTLKKTPAWDSIPWQDRTPRKIRERWDEITNQYLADNSVPEVIRLTNLQMAKEFGVEMDLGETTKPKPATQKPVEPPLPHSVETLKTALGYSDEVAIITDALAKAKGIDLSRVVYRRGGKPGSEALSQESDARDAEYLAAVEAGDMETAQRMVDEAAKRAGYDVGPVWHKTKPVTVKNDQGGWSYNGGDGWTVFDPEKTNSGVFYTTPNKEAADKWRKGTGGDELRKFFLKLENPKVDNENIDFMSQRRKDELIAQGYDGIRGSNKLWGDSSEQIAAFYPEQIKSADPVTRDADGNVIPLSQRFNPESPSILYQRSPDTARFEELTSSIPANPTQADLDAWRATHPDEYRELKAMRERVLRAQGYDKTVFHGTTATTYVEGRDTPTNEAAKDGLKEIASRLGLSERWQDTANIIENWDKYGFLEERGATKQDVLDARRFTDAMRGAPITRGRFMLGFDEFNMPEGDTELGIHVGNESSASMFGDVFQFQAKLGNTVRTKDLGTWSPNEVMDSLMLSKKVNFSEDEYDSVLQSDNPNAALRSLLKSKGVDSITYRNEVEGYGDSYILLDPTDLKSTEPLSTDATGALITPDQWGDTGNPSILYQRGSEPPSVERGHLMLREDFDAEIGKVKPLPREVFYVGDVEVIRNPSNSDRQRMSSEVRAEFGRDISGDPTTRFTNDERGNTWIWKAHQGMHSQVEPGIKRKEGVDVNQNARKPEHSDVVKQAIRDKRFIPDAVKAQYPQYAEFMDYTPVEESPSTLYQFAGENANVPQFMRDSLDTAKAMAAAGKPSEEIRAVTGWFPGKYDGKMRWEIPDNGATANPLVGVIGSNGVQALREGGIAGTTLGEVLNHPSLFDSYPHLKDTAVVFEQPGSRGEYAGMYHPSNDSISLVIDPANPAFLSEQQQSVLLHEVQHAIQQYEGFAKGSNESMFSDYTKEAASRKQRLLNEIDGLSDAFILKSYLEKGAESLGAAKDQFRSEFGRDPHEDAGQHAKYFTKDQLIKYADDLAQKVNRADKTLKKGSARQQYWNTAGEIEARDIQARANLTPEQLAATAPYSSENIAPETAIVLNQRGKGIKGSVEFLADGKALIRGFKSADASTGIHELTHVARRQLFDRSVPESQREGITDDDITTVEDFCGAKNGVWDEAAEEKFARANERYLYEGKAPSQLLAPIFAKMSAWLHEIYAQVKGSPIDIEISPAMREVLDKLYQRGDVNQAIADTPPEPLVPEIPPVEFAEPEPTPPGRASHEMSDQERANLGLPPRIPQPTVTDSDVWATAQATEDAHRAAGKPGTAGTDLMHSKLANMGFTLDSKEQALIIHEIVTRRNTLSAAQRTLNSLPKNAPDLTKSEAQKAVTEAQEKYQEVLDFNDAIGSEEGRAFRLRRWIMALDYTYEGLSRRLHAAKNAHTTGNALTPQEIAAAADYAAKLEQAQARLDALTSENAEQARLIEELTADVERAQKRDSATKSKVRKAVTDRAAEAKKRLQERGVTFLAQAQDIDAQTLKDFAAVAAEWLVDKPLTIAEFTQKLTTTFGTWISDHAERIFKTAKQTYNETAASVTGKSAPSPEQVIAEIEQSDAEEPTRKEVWQLARAYVIAGLRGENVLDSTHAALSELFNGLSRDRVAEIFTDYGITQHPKDRGPIMQELGRIKNLERIALKITDLKAGRIPKQTGYQRDPETINLEVRKLEREFRRLYKEEVEAGNIPDSGAEGRAKSALASAKTRMRNEIEELQDAIDRNRAMAAKKSSLKLDDEALDLRTQLEAKRNEYNEAFPKEGLTDEKRREILIRNLDRQIAQETQMLADGILKKVKTAPVADTPEIAERRRKLAALRKERRDLYDAANPLREAKANARRAIERLTAIIEKGRIDIKEKKPVNPDDELRALIETREALADEVDELRRASAEYQTRQIANALRAAEASLDRVSRKLASGDLSVPAKTITPASRDAAVQSIRARVKELNADLDARRREEKVGPYSDEARLTRELASLAKRKAELERRIREKDVSRKAKNMPLEDARKRRAQYEIELLKAEVSAMEERLTMKNAPLTKKAQYYGIGAANLLKIVTLGFDVGVVLRQLGTTYQALVSDLSVFSKNGDARKNGSHLARLIKTGVRAFADPAVESEIYEQVKNRPGAEYDKVGSKKIYFSPPFDTFESRKEEDIPRADLMKDIPWFVWPAIAGVKWFVFGMSPPAGVALVAVGALTKPLLTRLDRAQRAMTNVSRADFVDAARRAATAEGAIALKPADYSVMNNAVMVATGRGQIKKLDPAIPVANVVLLATRFYLSRIMALSLQPLFAEGIFTPKESRAGMRARTEVAKMYARSIAGRASLYALLWAMLGRSDDEKEKKGTGLILNPFSNDFGRYRVNENLKVDFMSGINSFASITARYLGRRRYDATTGKYTALGGGFRNNVNEEATRFLSSKMNLLTKFIVDTHAGQYFGGKPFDISKPETYKNAFEQASTAIITNDVVRVYEEMIGTYGKEEGAAKATAICLLMFGGMGASVRPSADEQRALKAMQKEIAKDEARRTRELNE